MGRARKFGKWAAVIAAVAALAFAIACNVAVLRGGRVRGEPLRDADAIIVLGAGIGPDGVSQVLGDRLDTALALYRDGRAEKILLTGDHASPNYDEVAAMRKYLEARGVPEGALLLDGAGVDTFNSISRARMVYGVERAIIVTQAFHLPRALWLARALGIDADGSEADRRAYRGAAWFQARELISRTKAWIDVGIGRTPRELSRVS
jgi:SanA protein